MPHFGEFGYRDLLTVPNSIIPDTNDAYDLGSAALAWRQIYTRYIRVIVGVESNLIPTVNNNYNLGSDTYEWKDLWIDGVAYIDSLALHVALDCDAIDINATGVGLVTAVIPVTVEGAVNYIAVYDSYT